jgi:YVTN family beta-propeller protein
MHKHSFINSYLFMVAAQLGLFGTASAQPYAYVSNLAGNNISIVNTTNNSVVGSVMVATAPTGLAVTPDGSAVYIASQTANVVSVLNTSNNSVGACINVGRTPTQLAVSPNGAQVYVVNQASNTVSVIDTASKSVIATIAVGLRPTGIAFHPSGTRAYVTNLWSGDVSVIDTASQSVTKTFAANSGPSGVAVSPDGRNVYISNEYSNTVTVHDSSGNLLNAIQGLTYPNSLAVTPNGSRLFVTNGNAASVSVIDTSSNTIVATLGVQSIPTSVAISPDGSRAYITNEFGFSVSVIDTASSSVMNTIKPIGVYPIAVAMMPAPTSAQPPPTVCTYSISPGSATYSSTGGGGTISISSSSGCAWTAGSDSGWIAITSGSSGSGTGTVAYTVASNPATGGRSGSLTIAGQKITISQSGMTCSYLLSSSSAWLNAGGGNGSVNVTAPAGCTWNGSSDSSWLAVTSGSSGNGNGTVNFAVSANTGMTGRSASLNIGGQTFSVTEAGLAFTPIRVNCGGTAFTDASGSGWSDDQQRNRSITMAPIANTPNPAIYQKETWSTGTLQYQFTVPNGSFSVRLHFAEIYLTQPGQRVFDIVINGITVAPHFDILGQTAPNSANIQTFTVNVTSGQLTIQLVPVTGSPKLAGIEIL